MAAEGLTRLARYEHQTLTADSANKRRDGNIRRLHRLRRFRFAPPVMPTGPAEAGVYHK
jgi:hypothetical protein